MQIASAACPSLHLLEQYLHDHLTPDDASRIDVHIDGCPSCQGRLDELIGDLPDYLPGLDPHSPAGTARLSEEPPPDLPGFQTVTRLATGGMGVVWRVHDLEFERTLAIKVMKRQSSRQPDHVQRFLQEARLCAQLAHPHIVPIHAMGRLRDGRPYYTMKLVEGETLAARLRRRNHCGEDLPELLQVFSRLCLAVAFAHRQGVIHRDLKPQNVMLGEHGEVQLMDWGLAKAIRSTQAAPDSAIGGSTRSPSAETAWSGQPADELDKDLDRGRASGPVSGSTNRTNRPTAAGETHHGHDRYATQAGDVLGTLSYMPPEQARGEVAAVDRRSDVFGLGAILCEIMTGAPAYRGTDFWSVRAAATEARLDDAHARLQSCGADPELIELARQLLAADKWDRPDSAEVVSTAIAAYLRGAEERSRQAELERLAAARPGNVLKRQWQRCRRRPLRSLLTLVAAAAGALLTIVLLQPTPKLRVGIKPWVGFAPLAVADDLDLCRGIDLVLEPVEDHDDALAKLARGEIDAVLTPLEGHVFARAAGYRTKAVLKLDDSLTADAIVARDSIRSASDLVGKQVVFVQMDVPQYLFLTFAERHGLTTRDVTLIAVPTAEEAVERFIHDETIAAVAIYEPYLHRALKQVPQAHVLATAEQEGGAVVDMLTIDETYLDSHPEHVQALAQGWFQAIDRLKQRDPRALHSACRFLGGKSGPPASEAQYDQMTAGMQYSDQFDNATFFAHDVAGHSEFRRRMLAAHGRLSEWGLLRDTTQPDAQAADGSGILLDMRHLKQLHSLDGTLESSSRIDQ